MALPAGRAGGDSSLVGDSVGMVTMGRPNTLEVTVDEMTYHCRAVMRAVKYALVIWNLPFLSYQTGIREAVTNAGLLRKCRGLDEVKLARPARIERYRTPSDSGFGRGNSIELEHEGIGTLRNQMMRKAG